MENNCGEVLDLSGRKLKKVLKPTQIETQITTLILDNNDLQRLDSIDSFSKVQKLSAVGNQLLRMYGVCRLHNLHTLNLAHNGILTIEGLKELVLLKSLNLAGNNIKTIEHLNTNLNLEHLDLSENTISHITDISMLKGLKELLLHNNKIGHLRQCERFLPAGLLTLTLSSNNIVDLNEISQLVHLTGLHSFSLANNPCVNMTGNKIGFDYRPFVINWCMSVQVIDGYVVDAIESLKAEWLYSQGRGRNFRIGDQQELSQYLASVCPLTGEQQLETEDDRKLRLILSKAQHHQQQLREQGNSPVPSPSVRKKFIGSKSSPRINSSRLSNRAKSPSRMTTSFYNSNSNSTDTFPMSQSLDPTMLSQTITPHELELVRTENTNGICLDDTEPINSPLQALSKLVPVPESLMSPDYRPSPLLSRLSQSTAMQTSFNSCNKTKIVQPVRSPKPNRSQIAKPKPNLSVENRRNNSPSPVRNRKNAPINNNTPYGNCTPPPYHKPLVSALKKSPSTEDESEICAAKLQTIQMKAEEKRLQKDAEMSSNSSGDEKAEMAAIFIQKMWRGYHTRNINKKVQDVYKTLQAQRADEYLRKLATDMESTKAALESERKIQMLQMQAINALWKKVSALKPENGTDVVATTSISTKPLDNADLVNNLAQTCTSLQSQIRQLQGSMENMVKFMTIFTQMPPSTNANQKESVAGTQTEIVAVHTPQGDAAKLFPFQKQTARPSSLPLPVSQRSVRRDSQPNNVEAEVRHFAGTLVDGVIKTVSETRADCIGVPQTTEITVTDTDRKYDAELATEAALLDAH